MLINLLQFYYPRQHVDEKSLVYPGLSRKDQSFLCLLFGNIKIEEKLEQIYQFTGIINMLGEAHSKESGGGPKSAKMEKVDFSGADLEKVDIHKFRSST